MLAPWHVLILIFWVLPWIVGGVVGHRKGRVALGILLGVLLSWIGVLVVAVLPPTRAELVRRERERMLIQQQAQFPPPGYQPPGYQPPGYQPPG